MTAGKIAMRSRLWRQRREKDGRLVDVWKESRRMLEDPNPVEDDEDPWLEELDLTDEERAALEDLEKWWEIVKKHLFISRSSPNQDLTNHQNSSHEEEDLPNVMTSPQEDGERQPASSETDSQYSLRRPHQSLLNQYQP